MQHALFHHVCYCTLCSIFTEVVTISYCYEIKQHLLLKMSASVSEF